MDAQPAQTVVSRHFQQGEQMDVAGLNRITVLVDRSQTALTEVGWNFWKPDLDGPPHFHEAKEQMFFATEGEATVTIAGHAHHLAVNSLLHVPMGAMHRTVVLGGRPHAYLLYNAFRDSDKEGKASFTDHLNEAKHIRRKQADDANQGGAIDWHRIQATGTLAQVDPSLPPTGTAELVDLIPRLATFRASAALLRLGAGQHLTLDTAGVEWTLFGLAGSGEVEAAGAQTLSTGTVLFVPAGTPATASASQGLACLCLRTHLP
jgi:mannose-6-phosphate isomerase-like protein (cupin superfamily)